MTKKILTAIAFSTCILAASCSSDGGDSEGTTTLSITPTTEMSTTSEPSESGTDTTVTDTTVTDTTVDESAEPPPAPTPEEIEELTPPATIADPDDFDRVPLPESPEDLVAGEDYETSFGWLVFDTNESVKGLEGPNGGIYGLIYGDEAVCENKSVALEEINAPGNEDQYFFTCLPGVNWNPETGVWE